MTTRRASLAAITLCPAFVYFVYFAVTLSAAEFTTPITISETDTTYDGQDIVISNTVVTIDGAHSFSSVLLTNGAVLTHLACTASETHKLEIDVSGTVTVDATSRIDVSGKGYLPGRTTGNTTEGGATGTAGGSYGGLGASYAGVANAVYGDYLDPDDWGSGGGGAFAPHGAGGGLMRLVAGRLALEDQLLADGQTVTYGAGVGGGNLRAGGHAQRQRQHPGQWWGQQ